MPSVLNTLGGAAIIIGATGLTGYAIDRCACQIHRKYAILILTSVAVSVSYFVSTTLWAN